MNVRLVMLLILSAVVGLSTALTLGWGNDQSANQPSLTGQSQSLPSEGKRSMEKLLGQFEKFAHPKATDFLIYRPKQLSETKIKQMLDAPYQGMEGLREPWLPADPDQIELIVAASSSTTLKNMSELRTLQMLRSISKHLKDKSRRRIPTKINFLNQQFSGLVRFTEPTRWDVLQKWFRADSDFKGRLSGTRINDLEVMRCEEKDTCIVMRLDERTFVIGSQAELESAVVETEGGASPNPFISRCIDEVCQSDFDGEFYQAKQLPNSKLKVNHMAAMVLQPIIGGEKISEARMSFSNDKKAIVTVELLLAADSAAAKFVSKTQEMVSRQVAMLEQETKLVPAGTDFGWQVKAMIDIAKTIEMSHSGSTVHVSVPRPSNLDELLQHYAKSVQSARDQIARHIQKGAAAIPADLPAGMSVHQPSQPVRSQAPVVKMLPILVAKSNIKAGTILQANHLKIENWPAKLVPQDALQKKEAAVGRRAVQIPRGLPVMPTHLE